MDWPDLWNWVAGAPAASWTFLKSAGLTPYIAVYGALLSTILAVTKSEWWQRRRLTVSCSLANEDYGNQVFVQNPSAVPVMIAHWELYWQAPDGTRDNVSPDDAPDNRGFTVGAHSRHVLEFLRQYHFSWGHAVRGESVLYLDLHFVGRKKPKKYRLHHYAD